METPKLEGVKRLLIAELKKIQKDKSDQQSEESILNTDDVNKNYIDDYIEKMSDEIIEIKKEKYKKELKKIKDKDELDRFIKETKKLLIEGFIIAFVVGLAVNQITDLLGIFKGSVENDSRILTYSCLFSVCLVGGSLIVYLWEFTSKLLKYVNYYRKKEG
jgi:hypothetical protein